MLKDLDPQLVQQLLQTFRAQLDDRVQAIAEGLMALEQAAEVSAREGVFEALFRAAHNIKGAARGVGLERSAELAHALESLFSLLRREAAAVPAGLIDTCLGALDQLRALAEREARGDSVADQAAALIAGLRALTGESPALPGAAVGQPASLPPGPAVTAGPAAAGPPSAAPGGAGDSVRLAVAKLDHIVGLAEDLQTVKIRLEDHALAARQLHAGLERLRRFWSQLALPRSGALADREALAAGADTLLELENLCRHLDDGLRASVSQMRPALLSLRDEVRGLRMVAAETVLKPLARVVRDTARQLGKQAELEIVGGQLGVDRAVLDALRDPLTHLLRNAVDHGLEDVEQRRRVLKPEVGRVVVALERAGNEVRISVADDGGGIGLDSIRGRVRELGLLSDEELARTDREQLLRFLFRPGFTTRREVSEISGRGVGLDVVNTQLQGLGGRIQVESEVGRGTRFLLTVPLTLAADHGLLIRCRGRLVAMPTRYVEHILERPRATVLDLEASQAVLVAGEPIPLRDLAATLGYPSADEGQPDDLLEIVVIRVGWRRVALRVDHVLGEREMVVKPLAPPLVSLRHVAGGALGREGDIVLVLDAAGISATALGLGGRVLARRAETASRVHRILVADDSITTRTLETSILEAAGYAVEAVADGVAAWERLQRDDIDLLLSDVEMPGLNGFELCQRIKSDNRLGDLPVILVTSLGSDEDRQRGMAARADAYIVKSSFDTRELLDMVRQFL